MRSCFFISRIGSPDSSERKFSNKLLEHIVSPAVLNAGFERPVRADQMTKPGIITSQVFTELWNADLVVADLTGANPNVYYELAVRHLRRKPCIHMLQRGEDLPFDVAPSRTIYFGFDIEEAVKARHDLEQMIHAAEGDSEVPSTALALAVQLLPGTGGQNVVEHGMTAILSALQEIRGVLDQNARPSPAEILAAIEKVGIAASAIPERQWRLWDTLSGRHVVAYAERPKAKDEGPATIQEFIRRKSEGVD